MSNRHPTKSVCVVTVTDPDTGGPVDMEIRKDMVTGAMVGIDASYLEGDVGDVYDPYNRGAVLDIPDNEMNPPSEADDETDKNP